jgi:acyl-[acyl-carrier-protein]-phospholipid O-acyltransferase/long-chain-fatty-acid--[acyl-carrier-protein] ligase
MKKMIIPIIKSLCRVLFRVEFNGDIEKIKQNNSPTGKLIIANHESFIDGLLLGLFLKEANPIFVVHTTVLKSRLFRLALSLIEHYAVDPTSPLAMKQIIKLINQGRNVVIFPEGRITTTGSLMKVYDGPGFIAYKTGAEIVPIRLEGPKFSIFSRLSNKYPKAIFPKVTISVLESTYIAEPGVESAKLKRKKAGEDLRHIMQNMLFKSTKLKTLYETFLDTAKTFGNNSVIAEDMRQEEFTYKAITKEIVGVSTILSNITQPKEIVGLLLPNITTTFSILMGLSASNRVPSFLNYTAGAEGIQSAIETGKMKTLISSRKFVELAKLEEVMKKVIAATNVNVVYLEDLKTMVSLKTKLWLLFYGFNFPKTIIENTDIEAPGVIIFTSGSEGKPKGVVLSHRALLSNVAQIKSIFSFGVEDKIFNALPMFHSFGLTAGTLLPILTGTKLFMYPSPLHYRIIPEIVYDRSCTVLFGTNTFLTKYANFANPHDFYSLRYVVAGAEKLADSTRDIWFEKFGIRVLEGYGATETAPVLAVNTPISYRKGSVGQFLPSVQHKLTPIAGIESGGLLSIKAPNLMSGYMKHTNPGVIEPVSCENHGDGWYNTGDIIAIDKDGFVFIQGRVKRFAKIAGEMISLEYSEKMANTISPTFAHASLSIPDKNKGEAVIVLTTDKELTKQMLIGVAKQLGYPELAVPAKIMIVEAVPVLGTGKTDYVGLKKLYESMVTE